MEKDKKQRKVGSLGSEMRRRVKEHTRTMSNHTRANYIRACSTFDSWRKEAGLSNSDIRKNPRAAVEMWRDSLLSTGFSVNTVHTYIAGICCGLNISMTGIVRSGTIADKRKSMGLSERSQKARVRPENADIVRFQAMVGGRRQALQRLTGADFVRDESGHWCVRFTRDKGGKTQYQRIAPEVVEEVRSYFETVEPEERLFPEEIDIHLDLHQIRAERARSEYLRYEKICSTPDGREQLRKELIARYTNPEIGCKAYLLALKRGNYTKARRLLETFKAEMTDGAYYLQRDNRKVALERGLPVSYDRLAICAVSVFSLSHWRNAVTVKHYLL